MWLSLFSSNDIRRPGSEHTLVQAAQEGSEEAVEALFRDFWPMAHRTAYLIVRDAAAAEDIAQEAFLAALRNLDRFDRRRPFAPWLHRIVVNRAIDWSRARALRPETTISGGIAARSYEESFPADSDIGSALQQLNEESRAVIVLRYLLEYTPGEIAEMLEVPRGTVNSRIRRGLDQLGQRLERS